MSSDEAVGLLQDTPVAPAGSPTPQEQEALQVRGITPQRRHGYYGPPGTDLHPATVTDDASYQALRPGAHFLDPEGKSRKKPWYVNTDADYATVPEGEHFIDPNGERRIKPKFEGIDYTAQTLFDMSLTDAERRKALERSYPGKVKQEESGEFYVEDEGGVRRKPGRGATAVTGAVTSMAAPVAGSILGGMGGGTLGAAAGTAVPGPGNIAGAVAGGIAGAAAGGATGQAINDIVLQLAGVYDRTALEEAKNLAVSGAGGAVGEGAGRMISAAVPVAKETGRQIARGSGKAINYVLGTDPEALKMASRMATEGETPGHGLLGQLGITEPGTATPPSAVFKEAPHIHISTEVREPALHTQKPLYQSAQRHYEREAGSLLEDLGVKGEGSIQKPTAAVSTEEAGRTILAKAQQKSVEADARLNATLEGMRTSTQAEKSVRVEQLRKDADDARKAAQALIDHGFDHIRGNVDAAMKATKAGHNSGDLWWTVGEEIKTFREGIQGRARIMYDNAQHLAGDIKPDAAGLSQIAEKFLEDLPGDFQTKHPDIVRKLRDLAGKPKTDLQGNPVPVEWEKDPVEPTWGQLHNLRSQFRGNVNWSDLTSDQWNGTYKFFAGKVDQVLHDANAVPELREASRALREADKFYAENMGPLNDTQIQGIVNGLRAGMPADPKVLNKLILKDGRTEVARKIESIVGANVWAGIRASDVQEMLDLSKTLTPGVVDGQKFAKEVLKRDQHNMLEVVHGSKGAGELREQARRIEMLGGRLEITPKEGDTVRDIISRAHQTAKAVKTAADSNPLGALKVEMKRLTAEKKADPLHFLYDPTTLATEAVDRILGNEDLIIAASKAFEGGEQSAEFNLMRQIWAQRILQGTLTPGERLAKVSPEVQQLMFPGVKLETAQRLAKEMALLQGTSTKSLQEGTASGMLARTTVEHPWGVITGLGKLAGPVKMLPGANFLARSILGGYFATMRKLVTSPVTLRFLERALENRDPEAREAAREMIREAMRRGGARGSGMSQAVHQQQNQGQELESVQ